MSEECPWCNKDLGIDFNHEITLEPDGDDLNGYYSGPCSECGKLIRISAYTEYDIEKDEDGV